MYYSKYFEGSVAASTASTQYAALIDKSGASTVSIASADKVKLKVLGDAIASTLNDCGMDAQYNVDTGYLYFDYSNSNIGMYLTSYGGVGYARFSYAYSVSGKTYMEGYSVSGTVNYSSIAFTSIGFNTAQLVAGNYKFCVTIKGDTSGFFTIYIGTYASPTSLTNQIGTFYRGTDKRDDSELFGIAIKTITPSIGAYWLRADTMECVMPYTSGSTTTPTLVTFASKLTIYNNVVVLIEQYVTSAAFIVPNNVYIDPGFGTSDNFYEIDGTVYFCYSPAITKCTTEVTPT